MRKKKIVIQYTRLPTWLITGYFNEMGLRTVSRHLCIYAQIAMAYKPYGAKVYKHGRLKNPKYPVCIRKD